MREQENEVLRRAAAYLSQANLPGKTASRLVRELAASGARVRVPVPVTCRVLKIARQPYHWLAASVTTSEIEQAYRANALHDAHGDDPEFGYRYLAPKQPAPVNRWPSAPRGRCARR